MRGDVYTGIFVAEGSSDAPLAGIVESLFAARGVALRLSAPDFERLGKVSKDVASRVEAGIRLMGGLQPDVVVVHRDADNAGMEARQQEVREAVKRVGYTNACVPVIPIRMTEAWLLLDEQAIRHVAGNPRGRAGLGLPKVHEVEALSDPKSYLRQCILKAAEVTGRRRESVAKRFPQHRRQLLDRLNCNGEVVRLDGWRALLESVEEVVLTFGG
ncbi:DUF4276 family protein [[Actinomadura] parvosata]|uniref:DUF4276 family protein n=1 Tax=[Actinomadura] parvosata TaxID=1955412 RepID=UPI0009AD3156|nr:DUF4276 family protein [Nonomuraea sp. ATCC 55076]